MKYEHIDPKAAIDALLAQHAKEADLATLASTVEIAKIDFLQGVRFVGGKEPDAELDAYALDRIAAKADAESKATDRIGRMTTPLDAKELTEARREQLGAWLVAWEAEHAQHGVLIELAETPEQVEASTLAQLVIEGAVLAARAELK